MTYRGERRPPGRLYEPGNGDAISTGIRETTNWPDADIGYTMHEQTTTDSGRSTHIVVESGHNVRVERPDLLPRPQFNG